MVGWAPRDYCDVWLEADEMSIHESDQNIERLERDICDPPSGIEYYKLDGSYQVRRRALTSPRIPDLIGTGMVGQSTKGKMKGVKRGPWSQMKTTKTGLSDRLPAIMFTLATITVLVLLGLYAADTISLSNTLAESAKSDPPAVPSSTPGDPFNWGPVFLIGAVVAGVAVLAVLAVLAYVWRAHLGPRARTSAAATLAAKADMREAKAAWEKAVTDEAEAITRWLAYEKDIDLAMRQPLMRDFSHPLVRETVEAMGEAAALRGGRPTVQPGREAAQQPYVVAVRCFTTALSLAQSQAERVGDRLLAPEQQADLKTARQLLRVIEDGASSVHERQSALRRMTTLLQGILVIPEQTMSEIEHRYVRLALASSPTAEKVPA